MDMLGWLVQWYKRNCNGEWEHFYGIKIETLDNPGWYVRIDLSETNYQQSDVKILEDDSAENDWIKCSITNNVFEGFGDSSKLENILEHFKKIVETGNSL